MTSRAKSPSMYGHCARCGRVRAINPRRGDHLCSSCRHFSIDQPPGEWIQDAACRTVDPEIFFTDSREASAYDEAIAVCSTCPVIEQCLDYAIAANIRHGVWGGLTTPQRQQMSRAS